MLHILEDRRVLPSVANRSNIQNWPWRCCAPGTPGCGTVNPIGLHRGKYRFVSPCLSRAPSRGHCFLPKLQRNSRQSRTVPRWKDLPLASSAQN